MTSTTHTIAEQVPAVRAGMEAQVPAEVLTTFDEERHTLSAAGIPATVPAPGTALPDGELLDIQGQSTTLSAVLGGSTAVLVFYRGAWCPWCNLTLRSYEQQLVPALNEQGIPLIAISPQKPDGAMTMRDSNELSYTVVSDPGNGIARRLGIVNPPRDENARAAALALGIDVAATNLDNTDDVPMPTAILVDSAGIIRWIDVHPDYVTRTEAHQILGAITALTQ